MAARTLLNEPRLADLEAPPIDPIREAPDIYLDRLRMQNCALDRLLRELAAEDHLVARDTQADGIR